MALKYTVEIRTGLNWLKIAISERLLSWWWWTLVSIVWRYVWIIWTSTDKLHHYLYCCCIRRYYQLDPNTHKAWKSRLHSTMSQKTVTLLFTVVRALNLNIQQEMKFSLEVPKVRNQVFLGMFTKLWISFDIFVCPWGTTRLPLDGF